jgi:hypothetical protein
MGLFTGVSIASPWILAFFPLALGGLFLLYRKQDTVLSIIAPSVFLVKDLVAPAHVKRTPFFPLRLLFEALIVLLLLLGSSTLSIHKEGKKYIFIIDNSFSMGAFLQDGQSRLEKAKADALLLLSELDAEKTRVFVSNPSLIELTTEDSGYAEAEAALRTIKLSYSEDALDQEIGELLSFYESDKIFIFTERGYPATANTIPLKLSLQRIPSERDDANIAFVKATISATSRELIVDILNSGEQAVSVDLLLTGIVPENNRGEVSLKEQNTTIGPKSTRTVSFGILPEEFTLFHASLSVNNVKRFNLHPLDDDVWLSLADEAPPIVVVSSKTKEELGLSKLNTFRFVSIKPEEFSSQAYPQTRGFIFHGAIPPQPVEKNSLLVLPPSSPLLRSKDLRKSTVISSWMDYHPTTRFVRFQNFRLKYLSIFHIPSWGRELLATPQGTIGVVGYNSKARIVALGFEIFPFEGKANPAVSIFTLNTFSWLFDNSRFNGFISLASQKKGMQSETLRYINPQNIPERGEEPHPGIAIRKEKDKEYYVAYNFFSPRESRLTTPDPLLIEPIEVSQKLKKSPISSRSLSRLLAFSVLVLLIGDLLLQATRALFNKKKSTL